MTLAYGLVVVAFWTGIFIALMVGGISALEYLEQFSNAIGGTN